MPIGEELSGAGLKAVKSPTIGAKPEGARQVFADCGDLVVRKAVRILGIAPVESELPCAPIQPVETILAPDPLLSSCTDQTTLLLRLFRMPGSCL
jgi:hypothetical protein